jgi:hypothetical protein
MGHPRSWASCLGLMSCLACGGSHTTSESTPAGGCCAGCDCLPTFVAQPAALDFGNVALGQTKALSLQVTNRGSVAVGLADAQLFGASDFSFATPLLPGPIAPGASAFVDVQFSPSSFEGPESASLEITGPQPLEVALTGNAVAADSADAGPAFSFSPDPIAFGTFPAGQSHTIAVTAMNLESTAITVQSLSLDAKGDPAFTLANVPALPAPLAPGAVLNFAVVDSPTSATGLTKNDLTVTFTVGASTTQFQADLFMAGGGS